LFKSELLVFSSLFAWWRIVQDLRTKRVPNNRSNPPHAGLWREVAKAMNITAVGIQGGRSPGANQELKASIGIPLDVRLNRSFTSSTNRIEWSVMT
jgi:hypothetical protein